MLPSLHPSLCVVFSKSVHGLVPRGGGEGETATGVMDPRTRENEARGIRWDNMVITLIRGWIWTDLTMFPSGSSISDWVYHQMQKSYEGCEVGQML